MAGMGPLGPFLAMLYQGGDRWCRGGPQGLRTTFPWVFWDFHGKYTIFI